MWAKDSAQLVEYMARIWEASGLGPSNSQDRHGCTPPDSQSWEVEEEIRNSRLSSAT